MARVSVAVLGLLALWWLLERILASDRGLDLSDEGLYLLGADPPSLTAAWGFPFGWHTRPLFALVGFDIATFRTLGALILVLASAWLGWAAARAVTRSATDRSRLLRWFVVNAALTGALGSLLFYAPMLRTPSYNWVNLVGLTFSMATALMLIAAFPGRAIDGRRVYTAILAGVSSVALFGTFPAKPTTLPIMLVLTTLLVLVASGWRVAGRWAMWNVVLMPLWLLLAVVFRIWPTDFLSVFRLALQMPAPDPLQTTGAAVRAAILLPRDVAAGLAAAPDYPVLTLMVGMACLLAAVIAARGWLLVRLLGFGLVVLSALAIAGVPIPLMRAQGEAFRIASSAVTTACLAILVAALLAAARQCPRVESVERRRDVRARWSTVGLLSAAPFVFSFGSGNGVYAQASLAAGLALAAACVGSARQTMTRDRVVMSAAVLGAASIMAVAAVGSGWLVPFRTAPLAQQTMPTVVGAHGAQLLLDPALSQGISGLRQQAEAAGWTPGTPLVDVSYMWNPAIPYALGARVPDFLALTIFGYSAAHDITDFHLSEPYRNFPFDQTWILTSRRSLLDGPMNSAVDFTLKKLSAASGRPFPNSYACVAAGDFVLWRPTSSTQETGEDCEG